MAAPSIPTPSGVDVFQSAAGLPQLFQGTRFIAESVPVRSAID